MLKKAGIIVAGSAVALLAASPLAFATPTYSHSPKCSFSASNDNRVAPQSATGFTALLGAAGAATNGAIPANVQTQAPVGSCNNVDNILNTTDTTTTIDKSKTKTIDKSRTINSGNSVTGPLGLGGLPL